MKTKIFSALTICLVVFSITACSPQAGTEKRPYLQAALEAAVWLENTAVKTATGTSWLADPKDPTTGANNLYAGTPGTVLFFLELHGVTGERRYLDIARSGADYLLAALPEEKGTGFYEGISGLGYVLEEVFKATGDAKYRKGVMDILNRIRQSSVKAGNGVEWSSVADIISGGAGTGLFLLYAGRSLDQPEWIQLAAEAGTHLIELGKPENGGLKWAMAADYPRLMPNFSHGTAGVSFFLARLFEETKNQKYMDAAQAGVRYLQSIAQPDTCLLFHDEPDGKDRFYYGWCHGPSGTTRLFYLMSKLTGQKSFMEFALKSAKTVMDSGIPDNEAAPGIWNNVGICCGLAGIAEMFLDLHKVTGDKTYREFADRLEGKIIAKATEENGGLKWTQAEFRSKPDLLIAQTGLMQGAAGIGLTLLHADAIEQGRALKSRMPDNPFPR